MILFYSTETAHSYMKAVGFHVFVIQMEDFSDPVDRVVANTCFVWHRVNPEGESLILLFVHLP